MKYPKEQSHGQSRNQCRGSHEQESCQAKCGKTEGFHVRAPVKWSAQAVSSSNMIVRILPKTNKKRPSVLHNYREPM